MTDRSKHTSAALTEIRTVRSRAQSAIERIESNDGQAESEWLPARMDEDGYVEASRRRYRDPDADEMVALLNEFIEKTAHFATRAQRKPGVINKRMGM